MLELPNVLKNVLVEKLAESVSRALPESSPRRVFGPVHLPGKASAIIGARRAGKTTFLHQLRGQRVKNGIPIEVSPWINFEDERLVDIKASHLSFLLNEYERQFPNARDKGPIAWFFDEIQSVKGWERFVRRLLDSTEAEVFITGSSAALLSREIATALRGRAWEVLIHPFSFAESLCHKGIDIPEDPDFLSAKDRSRLERAFTDWLLVGGYPEIQTLDSATRHRVLRDYVDVAMLRDVMERHNVSNVTGLRWLVRHLLSNAAGSFSVEKFYSSLKSQGVAISKDTVHQLLSHLEDCFLVRVVWMESKSERQRMVNPRKAYPVDAGLIPVFEPGDRSNIGHALETAVMIHLERRGMRVTYVRTQDGFEVDFLARSPDGSTELVQVCADASILSTGDREIRSLQKAAESFPGAIKRLLTLTNDGIPNEVPADVQAQPAYEWMLSHPGETAGSP